MRHCYVLSVFTRDGAGGNPLGVIPDTVDLSAEDMQAIAAELAYSETVFIAWAEGDMPAIRIFTPAAELPFAGHPVVGTAWTLNRIGPGAGSLRCRAGEVTVRLDDDLVWIVPPAGARRAEALADTAAWSGRVGVGGVKRGWWVEIPNRMLLLELATPPEVAATKPDMAAVAGLGEGTGLYVFAGRNPVRSRFFAPALGIDEDPATGAAAVALAAALASAGEGEGEVAIHQGEEMGAPSRLHLRWKGAAVELGGTVRRDEVRLLDR